MIIPTSPVHLFCFPYLLFIGLELALRHSHVGDQFLVHCSSRFAWGYSGKKADKSSDLIPPNADILFEVHVLSHDLIPPPSAIPSSSQKSDITALTSSLTSDDIGNEQAWLETNLRKVFPLKYFFIFI